jgi:ubiquinol-cytochrome c reductase iron-sulfur subunit
VSERPGRRLRDVLAATALLRLLRLLPGARAGEEREPGVPPPNVERELRSSAGAERAALAALLLATMGGAAFMVFYVAVPDTQLLGLALGGGLVALAAALVIAGKRIVPQEKAVEEREDFGDEELQHEVAEIIRRGGEGVSRRGMLLGGAGVAGATLGAAALFPAASLGPRVDGILGQTPWRRGRRVVDAEGRPLTVGDIAIGSFRTGFPEGASQRELGAPVVLVRLEEQEIDVPAQRRAAMPSGVIAFSKICPHAGCAISMYRHPLHEPTQPKPALVCPCHFSTFDVRRGGELIFGPAGRDLPQLPLAANAAGELVADGGFLDAIGPSWGGVRRTEDPS